MARGTTHSYMFTMKGCDMEASIDFSLLTCSTCRSRMTSEIVIILRAKNCLVGMSLVRTTRPNVPVPERREGEGREREMRERERERERGREREGERERERERERDELTMHA